MPIVWSDTHSQISQTPPSATPSANETTNMPTKWRVWVPSLGSGTTSARASAMYSVGARKNGSEKWATLSNHGIAS